MAPQRAPNWAKLGGIFGLIAGELYLFFTVASPRLTGVDIPLSVIATRLLALAPFFGGFGLAFGTGLGLLLGSLFPKPQSENPSERSPSLENTQDPHAP
jgi:hypothetical protein